MDSKIIDNKIGIKEVKDKSKTYGSDDYWWIDTYKITGIVAKEIFGMTCLKYESCLNIAYKVLSTKLTFGDGCGPYTEATIYDCINTEEAVTEGRVG